MKLYFIEVIYIILVCITNILLYFMFMNKTSLSGFIFLVERAAIINYWCINLVRKKSEWKSLSTMQGEHLSSTGTSN